MHTHVADEQVLGLLVGGERGAVRLTPKAALLVATKGGVGGVGVVVIDLQHHSEREILTQSPSADVPALSSCVGLQHVRDLPTRAPP